MRKHVPPYMRGLLLPFNWDVRRVWELGAPRGTIPIGALEFLLTNPFWSRNPDRFVDFDLRPTDVVWGCFESRYHRERIRKADTSFPLDFIEDDGTLWIVDGIHRLAKLHERGVPEVWIRKHPMSIRHHIELSD
ncbi:MAG: hypothetical protein LJE93_09145 [Acidobacteria bacterium]|jgi:hypothetical protein|nr:hypothetical protein [Acidobacteriota bacterium]